MKVERPSEEVACAPTAVGGHSGNASTDVAAAKVAKPGDPVNVNTPPKKKHPRCAVCNKKTGLASSYTCR